MNIPNEKRKEYPVLKRQYRKNYDLVGGLKKPAEESRPYPTGYVVNSSNINDFIKKMQNAVEESRKYSKDSALEEWSLLNRDLNKYYENNN